MAIEIINGKKVGGKITEASAETTSYNDTESQIGADNVQDAISSLKESLNEKTPLDYMTFVSQVSLTSVNTYCTITNDILKTAREIYVVLSANANQDENIIHMFRRENSTSSRASLYNGYAGAYSIAGGIIWNKTGTLQFSLTTVGSGYESDFKYGIIGFYYRQ